MYCEMCGTKIDDDSVFCENCGARIEASQDGVSEPADDLEELMDMDKGDGFSEASEKTMIFRKPHEEAEEPEGIDDLDGPDTSEEHETQPGGQGFEQEVLPAEEDVKVASEALAKPEKEDDRDSAWADREVPAQENWEVDLQETAQQEASDSESWAEKWGNGPEGSSSWDRGMTNTDEWLQEEIERTMRSLQQSSDHFVYEDRSGTILQGDPELFDEDEEYDKTGQADDTDKEPEPSAESSHIAAQREPLPELADGIEQPEHSADLKATPISFPPPIPPLDGEKKESKLLFCMACGKVLPPGAAFCQDCGTPTGAVAPGAIPGKTEDGLGIGLLKSFFKRPAGTIERAAADRGYLSGIGFFLIKDVILAVLAALLTKRVSAVAGTFSGWLLTDDPFAFAAKLFLCGIVLDALWVAVLWAVGKLFQAECSIKALVGVCGTAGIFTAVLLVITILLAAFVPAAVGCGLAVTGAVTLIAMVKATSAVMWLSEDQMMYHMAAAAACYSIILFGLLKLCQ